MAASPERMPAHLANLDLNLLVTLRELFRERNVTRAARRLGVSQPAVSASLSRLRRHFGDELLVRTGGVYVLTPLAAQLTEQVETVCAATERLFATGSAFEPADSRREFTLLMSDYPATVLGDRLSRLLAREAPHAALHMRLVRETIGGDIVETIRLVDGMVSPRLGHFRTPVSSQPLFTDRWMCLLSADHPLCEAESFSLADLTPLPWVVPYHRDAGYPSASPATRQLTALGIRPRSPCGWRATARCPTSSPVRGAWRCIPRGSRRGCRPSGACGPWNGARPARRDRRAPVVGHGLRQGSGERLAARPGRAGRGRGGAVRRAAPQRPRHRRTGRPGRPTAG